MLSLFLSIALAIRTDGISRYSSLKYPSDFKHFAYVNPDAPKGGTLRLATIGTFTSFNKDGIYYIAAQGLTMLHDPLMKKADDEPFTMYPLIAKNVEVADDNSHMTIYLDSRAKFHDGSNITAGDIKATIELLAEKGRATQRVLFSKCIRFEIKDPETLKIFFSPEDNGIFDRETPLMIMMLRPYSAKDIAAKGDFSKITFSPFLGSGPYRIKEYVAEKQIQYQRVKDYWAKDLPVNVGQYNFDNIVITYHRDVHKPFLEFTAGQDDYYNEMDSRHWHDEVLKLKNPGIEKLTFSHNLPVVRPTFLFNFRNAKFKDWRTRKAIALMFDFAQYNKLYGYGTMQQCKSLFPQNLAHCGAVSDNEKIVLQDFAKLQEIDHDVLSNGFNLNNNKHQAISLLQLAGWKMRNGKWCKGNEVLQIEFLFKDKRLEGLINHFAMGLKKIGIILQPRLIDQTIYESKIVKRDFEMIFHYWLNSNSPGREQGEAYFSVDAADKEGSSNYASIKVTALQNLALKLQSAKDYQELTTLTKALDRAIFSLHPFVPLMYTNQAYHAFWKDRLAHPKILPESGTNVLEWWWSK